ncbi:helix-turn-helix domain-containing protein [Streptomyces flavofungini]|uniref:helix-turn-helix domain-containing protein n=1 Tax=Streptomyces flavofungini TaxID=68200 RepID=UPI0025AFFD38|nr:helix-turn-helix domain-containing protein [Streptomyces flavofungini]WJV50856.1 helix-turn-helix domain-containing protein [Streptomyces flavofungini]
MRGDGIITGRGGQPRLGTVLRQRRESRGMSLRQMARLLHYSPGWISRVENGRAAPTAELARACDELLALDGELTALTRADRGGALELLRPAQLPPPASAFVGREALLHELDELLTDANRTGQALTIALDGPAGVGKSTVALRWAYEIADRFPGGVLFTDLQGNSPAARPLAAADVLEQFLTAFGLAATDIPADEAERAAVFRSVAVRRPILVILDDAAGSPHVEPLLVGARGCVALVTSRRRLTGLAVKAGAHRLSVGPMDQAESADLLSAVAGPERVAAEPTATAALARRCAHLPLALRIAAERLATFPHRSIADAVAELADRRHRLNVLTDIDDPHLAVRAALSSSYRALDVEAARMFRFLGLFPGATISAAAAAALADRPLGHTRRLLEVLVAVHLLEETGPDRYLRHDLLGDYAAERAAEEETAITRQEALRRLIGWHVRTAQDWGPPREPGRAWIDPHEVGIRRAVAACRLATDAGDFEQAARLFRQACAPFEDGR